MTIWLAIGAMGVLTFAIRLSFIWLFERREIPASLKQALRFVPTAALCALIAPDVAYNTTVGNVDLSIGNERLLAAVVAALIAWKTRHVFWTLVGGMAALLLFQAV